MRIFWTLKKDLDYLVGEMIQHDKVEAEKEKILRNKK